MFTIEITLYNNENQSEETVEINGDNLLSLKDELSNTILNNVRDTGCYNVEIIITEGCEYYDSDEFYVYVDVENQMVTQIDAFARKNV